MLAVLDLKLTFRKDFLHFSGKYLQFSNKTHTVYPRDILSSGDANPNLFFFKPLNLFGGLKKCPEAKMLLHFINLQKYIKHKCINL